MNIVMADQYVRNHTAILMAEAEQARLVRLARGPRRRSARRAANGS